MGGILGEGGQKDWLRMGTGEMDLSAEELPVTGKETGWTEVWLPGMWQE